MTAQSPMTPIAEYKGLKFYHAEAGAHFTKPGIHVWVPDLETHVYALAEDEDHRFWPVDPEDAELSLCGVCGKAIPEGAPVVLDVEVGASHAGHYADEHVVGINNRFLEGDYWAECSCGWQGEGTAKELAEEQAQDHTRTQKSNFAKGGDDAAV